MSVVVAIDAGTTGVRSVAVDPSGRPVGWSYREITQHYPRPGWVEHDAEEIWQAVAATLSELVGRLDEPVEAIGITNQRETVVVWDRQTGRPVGPALVWQDRRSAAICTRMVQAGHLDLLRQRTGLVPDPYFSATKLAWLVEEQGLTLGPSLAVGTVDSWLIWRLTSEKVHATDPTNASRTMLFDICGLRWDPELLELFGVPEACLPEVHPSSGRFGTTASGVVEGLGSGVPISGVAGDQQAALFGQACFEAGMTKNTYGTGSFVLMNVGGRCPPPPAGLLVTLGWTLADQVPTYALEGSIFVTGAAVQWLRDGLGVISEAAQTESLASQVPDSGGVVLVPAFAGLGSPYWDPDARGSLMGLSRGIGPAHLARAVVDSMVQQTVDVVEAMRQAAGVDPKELRVDGGASAMELLVRLQADALGVTVVRSARTETTALGAAFLAGLAEGVWADLAAVADCWEADLRAEPSPDRNPEPARRTWLAAVAKTRSFR